ncbi:Formyltetrahydrofolate-dependent phosphoribosylglycinamide formyltransferase [Planktothrix serta PCC 8927]|uniref:Phosphoribosylglycinamide formyltransferase n=1 Tax=Planktothrix serta PCC 8927 TaxID=671068 RepID=A0A7Z9C342_9CYAN|nr:phosphoribosylglycinamide formyltransferase [Planktothrix serta]VXD24820.1 Formyltetrahydrofolate-dependent phosphoribosylglycinamide formyltransferase [Planktothrix serta PCC 8927]
MNATVTGIDSTDCLISPAIPSPLFVEGTPVKIGVLASGSGTNFEAIAQAIQDQQLNAKIQVLIYNNPDAQVIERAQRFGVKTILLNHRHYKKREDLDREIVKTLKEHDVDWIVFAGWMRIVTQVLVDAFPQKIINLHPSLLPSFPGIRGVEQALEAKVKITGCSVHLVEVEVDSGPILMQAAVPILADDTPETLHARIQVQEHKILIGAISLVSQWQNQKST